jgi:hypothetical protein
VYWNENTDQLEVYVDGNMIAYINKTPVIGMQTIKWDAVPSSNLKAHGIITPFIANSNMVFGDVCYLNSSGRMVLCDADAIATSNAIAMCVSSAVASGTTGNFMFMGIARRDVWNWTVGGKIYLSVTGTSGNTITQTAPSGTNDVVQCLGVAVHADRVYFNPSLVQVECV